MKASVQVETTLTQVVELPDGLSVKDFNNMSYDDRKDWLEDELLLSGSITDFSVCGIHIPKKKES